MSEEQQVEVELEEPLVGGAESGLGLVGVVHEPIGDEAQRPVLLPADHAVADRERLMRRAVEGRLVGAQRIDLVRDHSAG